MNQRLLDSRLYMTKLHIVQASPVASPTRSESECSYESSLSAEDDPDSDQAASPQLARDVRHEAVEQNSDLLPDPDEAQEPSGPDPASNTVKARVSVLCPASLALSSNSRTGWKTGCKAHPLRLCWESLTTKTSWLCAQSICLCWI